MEVSNAFKSIKLFFANNRNYYKENHSLINENNRKMLVRGTITYLIILFFYTLFTYVHFASKQLFIMYLCFDSFHIIFTGLVLYLFLRSKLTDKISRVLVYILEISLLLFFDLEAILANPNSHSLYIPIAIFLVVVVFNHSLLYLLILSLIYVSIFVIGSFIVKPFDIAMKDLEIGFATYVATTISSFFLAHLHHNLSRWIHKYQELCKKDQFTDLYNKASIIDLAKSFIAKQKFEEHFVVSIMDLDNFKAINDTYGHQSGDKALTLFTKELKKSFYKDTLIGRYGGDEFILVKKIESKKAFEDELKAFLDRIINIEVPGLQFIVSCSIGFAVAKGSENDFDTLLAKADKCLYYCKKNGKANWECED